MNYPLIKPAYLYHSAVRKVIPAHGVILALKGCKVYRACMALKGSEAIQDYPAALEALKGQKGVSVKKVIKAIREQEALKALEDCGARKAQLEHLVKTARTEGLRIGNE